MGGEGEVGEEVGVVGGGEAVRGRKNNTPEEGAHQQRVRKRKWDTVEPSTPPPPPPPPTTTTTTTTTSARPDSLLPTPSLAPPPIITEDQVRAVQAAQRFAAEKLAQLTQQRTGTTSAARIQQLQCRLYIGGLPMDVSEVQLRSAFAPFGPIKCVTIPKEPSGALKGFAFIEYAYAGACNAALSNMNGYQLNGRSIRVSRPHDAAAAGVGGPVSPTAHTVPRVYVGNVYWEISDVDVSKLFATYGRVKSCQLLPSSEAPGRHRGFGFVEFESLQEAHDAIAHMNGFELAGRHLKVSLANSAVASLTAAGLAMSSPSSSVPPEAGDQSLSTEEDVRISSSQRFHLMQKLAREDFTLGGNASRCIVLRNMVGPEDVDDELEAEVSDECGKYGSIERVKIHDEKPGVEILVHFRTATDAANALLHLDRRWFGGRQIRAERVVPRGGSDSSG